jgi:DNA-binding GntR family transcriptional regulator
MIELEAEGFIAKTPNSATHVTKLSWAQAEKVFAVRRVLEGLAVEEACRVAGPECVAGLESAAREMMDHARARDGRAFNRADRDFHQALWRAPGNEYLEIALNRALGPYFAFGAIRIISQDNTDLLHDAALHLAIVEAIGRRDPEAARRAYDAAFDEWRAACRNDLAPQAAGAR